MVQKLLSSSGRSFIVNSNLVRGLDYYTRTVFEVKSAKLKGSQDALAAGGRYDSLVKSMGGPDVPAVGWALGVDRMILDLPENGADATAGGARAFVISAAGATEAGVSHAYSECDARAFGVLNDLRSAGIPADGGMFGQSLKSQMRMAGKSGAAYAVIVGENELKARTCMLKDLRTGNQETVPLNKITKKLGTDT